MNKHVKLYFFVLLFCLSCSSLKEKPAIGMFSWEQWQEKNPWFRMIDTNNYDNIKINELSELLKQKNIKLIIIVTSFCDECIESLPIIINILKQANITTDSYTIFGLDDSLTEPTGYYKSFSIHSTPDIHVLINNKDVGSISYPSIWLDSLINILKNNKQ